MKIATRITRHRERLFNYACRLTHGNRADAEDLVQETFLRALEHEDSFAGNEDGLVRWLHGILRNTFLGECKHRRVIERAGDRIFPLLMPITNNKALAELEFEDVSREIRRLPDLQLRALVMITMANVSYRVAAGIEGVPEGTIKSRVNRARSLLAAVCER
jgi:RNA polymerase sigma-70 factor, ECF subfamily